MQYLTAKDVEITFGGVKIDASSITIEHSRKNLQRAIDYIRGLKENPRPIRVTARWIIPPPGHLPCVDARGHRWRLNGSRYEVDLRPFEVEAFATTRRRFTLLRCANCDARRTL